MPLFWAYFFATGYRSAQQNRHNARILDIVLSEKQWEIRPGSEEDQIYEGVVRLAK